MITWIIGYPNIGKTTLAKQFQKENENVILLDGDEVRSCIQEPNYEINLAYLANILSKQGYDVVIASRVMDDKTEITKICNPEWVEL